MRILYLSDLEIPVVHGEAICNAKLIRALMSAGHEVFLISRRNRQSHLRYMPVPGWERIGCPGRYIEVFVDSSDSEAHWVTRLLWAVDPFCTPGYLDPAWVTAASEVLGTEIDRFEPDVVFTTFPRWNHLAALRQRRKRKFLWIASLNDPWERRTLFAQPPWYSHVYRYHRAIISLLAASVDAFVFPSKRLEMFERKFSYGPWPSAIGIIPHVGGVAEEGVLRDDRKFRLVHAGDLCNVGKSECKFPEGLAEAISRQPMLKGTLEVVFVGDIPEEFKRRMQAVGVVVHWVPWCAYPDALKYMASADVNFLIEANYPVGGVLMLAKVADYALAGKPILALSPEDGYMADLARQNECLIAATNDSSEIAGKILMLYDAWTTGGLDSHAPRELVKICRPESAAAKFEALVRSITEASGSLNV